MVRALVLATLFVALSTAVAAADEVLEPPPALEDSQPEAPFRLPPWALATLAIGVGGLLLLRKRLKRDAAERHQRTMDEDAAAEAELVRDVRSMVGGPEDDEPS